MPAGSARDVFLHVRDELLEEAHNFLARRLAGRAVVYRTADLIAAGFFGAAPVSETFLGRVGNLVVLPYRGEAVWWYEQGPLRAEVTSATMAGSRRRRWKYRCWYCFDKETLINTLHARVFGIDDGGA